MKKIRKNEYGYIKYEKKRRMLMLLIYICIGITIFVVGYIINKGNKANLFTILAFLSVLPAAKRLVELIVILPYQTPPPEQYEQIKTKIGQDAVLLCDYVFTSKDKVMSLDFLIIEKGTIIGVTSHKKQNMTYLRDYLTKNIHHQAPDYTVMIADDTKDMIRIYNEIKEKEIADEQTEEIIKQLRILSV
ncbi:MAG: hypothetical protein LBR68_02860 [Lachnoclostridium sp.]|jgi:hypothetical protein|nr:hypothetical protein [Lachnoclostridium sp.]